MSRSPPDPPAPGRDHRESFFLSRWAALLLPLAAVYGWVARRRRRARARRACRVPVPVISVGNITVGGTGKTPFVELVAGELERRGLRAAILSRGYGSRGAGKPNDEYRVLAENVPGVPHFQDADRVRAARAAVAAGAEVLVLDDGFQHVALARDLDVLLLDAVNPFGFGRVLPAGLLREPLEALSHADLFVLTRGRHVADAKRRLLENYLRWRFPGIPRAEVDFVAVGWVGIRDGAAAPPGALEGTRVVAFAGIGNPEGFRRELQGLGLRVLRWLRFPDHHRYQARDVARIIREATGTGAQAVVATQKDAVKLRDLVLPDTLPWYYLRIRPRLVSGEDTFETVLERALARAPRGRGSSAR